MSLSKIVENIARVKLEAENALELAEMIHNEITMTNPMVLARYGAWNFAYGKKETLWFKDEPYKIVSGSLCFKLNSRLSPVKWVKIGTCETGNYTVGLINFKKELILAKDEIDQENLGDVLESMIEATR